MLVIDTVSIAWLALVFLGCRRAGEDYLGRQSSNSLRGVFAITVVLHHLACIAYQGALFRLFSYMGYCSVSVFFFLSGYGLMTRLGEEGAVYIKSLLSRRIPRLALVYVFATALYSLFWSLLGYNVTLPYVLRSLINGSPIALNSWYVLSLLVFYLCFCGIFAVFSKRIPLGCAVMGAVVVAYVLALHSLGYDYHWYMSAPAFVVGLLWARYKGRIDGFVRGRWGLVAGGTFLLFAALFALAGVTMLNPVPGLSLGSRLASSAIFPVLVMLLSMRLRLHNPALSFLGNISLELYLFHGLAYCFLRSSVVYIQSSALWVWLSILLSIALAWAAHKVLKLIKLA